MRARVEQHGPGLRVLVHAHDQIAAALRERGVRHVPARLVHRALRAPRDVVRAERHELAPAVGQEQKRGAVGRKRRGDVVDVPRVRRDVRRRAALPVVEPDVLVHRGAGLRERHVATVGRDRPDLVAFRVPEEHRAAVSVRRVLVEIEVPRVALVRGHEEGRPVIGEAEEARRVLRAGGEVGDVPARVAHVDVRQLVPALIARVEHALVIRKVRQREDALRRGARQADGGAAGHRNGVGVPDPGAVGRHEDLAPVGRPRRAGVGHVSVEILHGVLRGREHLYRGARRLRLRLASHAARRERRDDRDQTNHPTGHCSSSHCAMYLRCYHVTTTFPKLSLLSIR